MTLIEVVVGTALLGTLAVVSMLTTASHLRQLRNAESKITACRIADQFLAAWSQSNFDWKQLEKVATDYELEIANATSSESKANTWYLTLTPNAEVPEFNGKAYELTIAQKPRIEQKCVRLHLVLANPTE